MAIRVVCRSCEQELNKAGALVISPPDTSGFVHKSHICLKCWKLLMAFIDRGCSESSRE